MTGTTHGSPEYNRPAPLKKTLVPRFFSGKRGQPIKMSHCLCGKASRASSKETKPRPRHSQFTFSLQVSGVQRSYYRQCSSLEIKLQNEIS